MLSGRGDGSKRCDANKDLRLVAKRRRSDVLGYAAAQMRREAEQQS